MPVGPHGCFRFLVHPLNPSRAVVAGIAARLTLLLLVSSPRNRSNCLCPNPVNGSSPYLHLPVFTVFHFKPTHGKNAATRLVALSRLSVTERYRRKHRVLGLDGSRLLALVPRQHTS